MATQADMLISYINDLQRFERRLRYMAENNEALTRRTRALVADSLTQIGHDSVDGLMRENRTFVPSDSH